MTELSLSGLFIGNLEERVKRKERGIYFEET